MTTTLPSSKRASSTNVVASRQPERDRWLADFEDTDGFAPVRRQPSLLNPAQKKTAIEVKTRVEDEHTYVLCRSEQRIAKDHRSGITGQEALAAPISNGGNLSVDLSQGGLGNLEASGDFGH